MEIKIKKRFSEDLLKSNGLYSFLNLSSIGYYLKSENDNSNINFFCDGMLLSSLLSVLCSTYICRVSFDFTSIAKDVLKYAEINNLGIIFIGASVEEAKEFKFKITSKYPSLDVETISGYFNKDDISNIHEMLSSSRFKIVVAGLGAPKQDYFINTLFKEHPNKIYFTCGGFIRQESKKVNDYYPAYIEKTKTRAFYRMCKEPHTISRYLIDYPKNLILLIIQTCRKKISFVVVK